VKNAYLYAVQSIDRRKAMKMRLFLTSVVILFTTVCYSQNITYKYPDGSYKVSDNNGKTWKHYDIPKITFIYENFTKISEDNGKTWIKVEEAVNMTGFIVSEDFIHIDAITDKKPVSYRLMTDNGNVVEEDEIKQEYIMFQKEYSGLHFIILEYDNEKSEIYKLLF
jgi:hypothetical protein